MSVELEEARARWRDAVADVLAKNGRRPPEDAPAERALDSRTYEVSPLEPYTPHWTPCRSVPFPGIGRSCGAEIATAMS